MEVTEPLVETWCINDRLNRFLLTEVGAERLAVPLTKGKVVSSQFVHIHHVRLMWIKVAAPAKYALLAKIDSAAPTVEMLSDNLEASGLILAEIIADSVTAGGRVKGFKPHVSAFVGYLIAHEANHRGQVELALRQAGVPLSDKAAYGLWEWGVR